MSESSREERRGVEQLFVCGGGGQRGVCFAQLLFERIELREGCIAPVALL